MGLTREMISSPFIYRHALALFWRSHQFLQGVVERVMKTEAQYKVIYRGRVRGSLSVMFPDLLDARFHHRYRGTQSAL